MNLTKHPAEMTPKRAIETAGEVFPGGEMIELLAGAPGGEPRLLLFWRQREDDRVVMPGIQGPTISAAADCAQYLARISVAQPPAHIRVDARTPA